MGRVCPECSSTSISQDPDTSEYYCDECGTVVAGADYRSEFPVTGVSKGPSMKGSAMKYASKEEDFTQLKICCDSLGISKEDTAAAKEKYRKLSHYHDNYWPTGKPAQFRSVACIYLSIKNKKPISIVEIANQCQLPKDKLMRVLKQAKQDIANADGITQETAIQKANVTSSSKTATEQNLFSFVDKYCSQFNPPLETEDRIKVIKNSKFLIQVGSVNSLIEGRNPLGILAATILLSLEIYSLSKQLTNQAKENFCKLLNVSIQTAQARKREFHKVLEDKANALLPWNVSKSSISTFFEDIRIFLEMEVQEYTKEQESKRTLSEPVTQQHVNTQTNAPTQSVPDCKPYSEESLRTLPPSFRASLNARKKRETKIRAAERRIRLTMQETDSTIIYHVPDEDDLIDSTPLDSEDLLIEKLLLSGINATKLAEGYYDNYLESLQPLPTHDVYSSDLTEDDMPEEELKRYIHQTPEAIGVGHKRAVELDAPAPKRAKTSDSDV